MDTSTTTTTEEVLTPFQDICSDKSYCCYCRDLVDFKGPSPDQLECEKCEHERCQYCFNLDLYKLEQHSDVSGDEGYEEYRIENDEADKSLLKTKRGMFAVKDIVEDGVNNIDLLIKVVFPKVEMSKVESMAAELKTMIAFEALTPDARPIKLAWSHRNRHWTYRRDKANKVPFIIIAFNGALKTRAMNQLFSAAPRTAVDAYPWFNYDTDRLFFEYERCGSRDRDVREYIRSMKIAAKHLRDHADDILPRVKHIELTWCQRAESPAEILSHFNGIDGLESIDLICHDHYKDAYEDRMTNHANRWQYDPSEIQYMVNRGRLEGEPRPYSFKVRLFGWDGDEYIFGTKPCPGRGGADEDSDEDSDEESNDGSEEDNGSDGDLDEDSDKDSDEESNDGSEEDNGSVEEGSDEE